MRTSTAGRFNNQSGFTLIELALVVVLLGIMASYSLPLISGLEPDQLKATARRLSGTVKYLYNEAVMTGTEHHLVFNLTEGSYHAAQRDADGKVTELGNLGRRHQLPDDVKFDSIYQPQRGEKKTGKVTTIFKPEGWLEETIIHLRDEDQHKLTIRLVPLTGLSEIYDGYRDFK